jgi:septum formation protein
MLVLASRSPRRSEILRNAGIPFVVRAAEVDETPREHERAEDYVRRLAEEKARAVDATPGEIVLAADTTVVIDGQILGKPAGRNEAIDMLLALSGRKHEVLTGFCLKHGEQTIVDWAVTYVWFNEMSDREIEEYADSGEPMDKAGGYAIQGLASKFIQRVDGCYFNVVGLPIAMVYRYLRQMDSK